MDGSVLGVAPSLPGSHFLCEKFLIADSTIQALPSERGDLDFRHVQPTGVLGRVVKDDAAQQLARHPRTEDLDEACSKVRVEIVEDQMGLGRNSDRPRAAAT